MRLINQLHTIKVHMATVEANILELESKNRKSAGPRARKAIQSCRSLLTDLRKEIMVSVRAIPTKTKKQVSLNPDVEIIPNSDDDEPKPIKPKRKYTKRKDTQKK